MAHGSMEDSNVNPFVESKQVLPFVFHCKSVKECFSFACKVSISLDFKAGIRWQAIQASKLKIFYLIIRYCADGQLK